MLSRQIRGNTLVRLALFAQKHTPSWNFLVPPRGLEPRTNGLKVRCSTVELEGPDRCRRWTEPPTIGPEPGWRGYRLTLARQSPIQRRARAPVIGRQQCASVSMFGPWRR